MREITVEKYLKLQVERMGGKCFKWRCLGYNGAPDRIVLFPYGAVFFVELKAPKNGRVRPTQHVFHNFLRSLGHEVLVLNTKEKVNEWVKMQASALLAGELGKA